MAVTGTLVVSTQTVQPTEGQPFTMVLTLTNGGGANVTVSSIAPYILSNGAPFVTALVGVPTTIGNVSTIPASNGTLVYTWGVVFLQPVASPETQALGSQASNQPDTVGVTAVCSDGSVVNATVSLTPTLPDAIPAAAGQFIYSSSLNSPNWFFT